VGQRDLRGQGNADGGQQHRQDEAGWLAGTVAATDVQAGHDGHQLDHHGVGPADPGWLSVRDGDVVDVHEGCGAGHDAHEQQDQDLDDALDVGGAVGGHDAARGCASPVSAANAVATSWTVALT
jgi:hypothetical protein